MGSTSIHALPEGLIKDYEYEISDEDDIAIVSKYLSQNCTYDFKLPEHTYKSLVINGATAPISL